MRHRATVGSSLRNAGHSEQVSTKRYGVRLLSFHACFISQAASESLVRKRVVLTC